LSLDPDTVYVGETDVPYVTVETFNPPDAGPEDLRYGSGLRIVPREAHEGGPLILSPADAERFAAIVIRKRFEEE
jgi:hypothetical protein